MFNGVRKQTKASYSVSVFLLTVFTINLTVMAQTNPMDSTPSRTDVFTQQQLMNKMGVAASSSSPASTSSLPFPVSKTYPSLYVIPADKRPKIMNQGDCGSCVAYSTSTVLSTMLYSQTSVMNSLGIANSSANALSPDPMVLFKNAGKNCKDGWDDSSAIHYFARHDIPMLVNTGLTNIPLPGLTIRAGDAGGIGPGTTLPAGMTKFDAMRSFISTQGALVAEMTIFESFNRYKTGIYNNQKFNDQMIKFAGAFFPGKPTADIKAGLEKSVGGHAVTVIGYFVGGKVKLYDLLNALGSPHFGLPNNDLDLPAFWVVQNSWGSTWGINGLALIEANQPGLGLDDRMYYMTGPIVMKNGSVVH